MRAPAGLAAFVCLACGVADAHAREPRVSVTGGGAWAGAHRLGAARAEFEENRAPSGGRLTYFDTATRLEAASGWSARLSVRVYGPVWVEGGVGWADRNMITAISNDFEAAPETTASATLRERVVEGGLRWDLRRLAIGGGRAVPFLWAGGGSVRHEPASGLARTGHSYGGGAGVLVRVLAPARGLVRGLGLRLEGGVVWRGGAFELADRRRTAPRATVAAYVGF